MTVPSGKTHPRRPLLTALSLYVWLGAVALSCGQALQSRLVAYQNHDVYGVGPSNVWAPARQILPVRKDGSAYGIRFDDVNSDPKTETYCAEMTVMTKVAGRWVAGPQVPLRELPGGEQ